MDNDFAKDIDDLQSLEIAKKFEKLKIAIYRDPKIVAKSSKKQKRNNNNIQFQQYFKELQYYEQFYQKNIIECRNKLSMLNSRKKKAILTMKIIPVPYDEDEISLVQTLENNNKRLEQYLKLHPISFHSLKAPADELIALEDENFTRKCNLNKRAKLLNNSKNHYIQQSSENFSSIYSKFQMANTHIHKSQTGIIETKKNISILCSSIKQRQFDLKIAKEDIKNQQINLDRLKKELSQKLAIKEQKVAKLSQIINEIYSLRNQLNLKAKEIVDLTQKTEEMVQKKDEINHFKETLERDKLLHEQMKKENYQKLKQIEKMRIQLKLNSDNLKSKKELLIQEQLKYEQNEIKANSFERNVENLEQQLKNNGLAFESTLNESQLELDAIELSPTKNLSFNQSLTIEEELSFLLSHNE